MLGSEQLEEGKTQAWLLLGSEQELVGRHLCEWVCGAVHDLARPALVPDASTCTHRQLLPYVLCGCLQGPCAFGGLILHSFHGLEQGCHIGHHHLGTSEEVGERSS